MKSTCSKSKNDHSLVKNQSKYESNQQLADLQVECLNKSKTIQEHEKYIEEMKDNVRKLEVELEELHKKQAAIEELHKKEMEKMVNIIFPNRNYMDQYVILFFHHAFTNIYFILICRQKHNRL